MRKRSSQKNEVTNLLRGIKKLPSGQFFAGSATRARTWDILVNSEALYQLSYRGIPENHIKKSLIINQNGPKQIQHESGGQLYPTETAPWHLLYLPSKEARLIRQSHKTKERGWSSLPVEGETGKTKWRTSIRTK